MKHVFNLPVALKVYFVLEAVFITFCLYHYGPTPLGLLTCCVLTMVALFASYFAGVVTGQIVTKAPPANPQTDFQPTLLE